MRLPRWTVYPALAVIGALVVTAVPRAGYAPQNEGAAKRARAAYLERQQAAARSERVELPVTPVAEESAPDRPGLGD